MSKPEMNEAIFAVGQLVEFEQADTTITDCPHCGQEYEETLGTSIVVTKVKEIHSDYRRYKDGVWFGKHSYSLECGNCVEEQYLTAVEAA